MHFGCIMKSSYKGEADAVPDFESQLREFEARDELRARRELLIQARRKRHRQQIVLAVLAVLFIAVTLTLVLVTVRRGSGSGAGGTKGKDKDEDEDETGETLETPDWITEDLLTVNEYSRPGTPLEEVRAVVVHYVGNPGTTAQQNRNYFQNLSLTHETSASSHFVVGLEGEIIQCVPLDEWSYCSSSANAWSVAIEVCHPDETGKFNRETRDSLVKLLRWLVELYGLDRDGVIRHYDVTGKICPKYYVENPDQWEKLLDDVFEEN